MMYNIIEYNFVAKRINHEFFIELIGVIWVFIRYIFVIM